MMEEAEIGMASVEAIAAIIAGDKQFILGQRVALHYRTAQQISAFFKGHGLVTKAESSSRNPYATEILSANRSYGTVRLIVKDILNPAIYASDTYVNVSPSDVAKHLNQYLASDGFQIVLRGAGFDLVPTGGIPDVLLETCAIPVTLLSEEDRPLVERAIADFADKSSDEVTRRSALTNLGHVLERLRPDIKGKLTKKDENDIFELLNNFGIRHHGVNQQSDYNAEIFYAWLFAYLIAAIRACCEILQQSLESDEELF